MLSAILSGIFIGTSYIPFPPWAGLFCLVPLWSYWVKNKLSIKQIFITGFVTQFILAIIGFHWIAHTVVEFGHMPFLIGVIVLILFAATQNLYIPLAGVALKWVERKSKKELSLSLKLVLLATLTSIFEILYPKVFDWNFGYSWLWAKWPMYQIADTIGFSGLSYITLLANALLAFVWIVRSKKTILPLLAGFFIFVTLNTIGYFKQKKWSRPDSKVQIGVIQANIGNFEKFLAEQGEFRPKVYKKYFELTRKLLTENPDVDLILWPETAFPGNLDIWTHIGNYQKDFLQFVKQINKPILTGAYSAEKLTDDYYNGFYLFDKEANLKGMYRKTHLLAFGEYFPGSKIFPFLKDVIPAISNFSKGLGPKVLELNNLRFGAQICYEGLYPAFTASLAEKGSNILVNVTNDSWFGHTFEPHQHLFMTFARAIEARRPLIRSTNTGISSGILANGTLLPSSPQLREWVGVYEIPFYENPPMTFHSKFGKHLWIFEILFCLMLIGMSFRREKLK